ncbi:carboxy-S-adenosyl-L-methionine synthase CmoA [Candidatus Methylobacter oryzae]|uniref:Carboxy-S-adenosyl-L-methionine synthase n=1 Tax=Candidatus Methylobacter oryzae TaxID=2497749 RepID=A0ABY3CD93_9GAMM|nr:carboxy-S-adenosyl-L-methionine synthase CmoA [Candidatus Methylobacter oryzae]TRX00653.1 carboxy-S-adenosyl-L-methionine synthase CmoA [Candidatus Methylobacter oryzae]
MNSSKDSLYASPIGEVGAFKFDETVVNVFPDMIQRSVPGYSAIISAIGLLAGRFAREHSVCYDLGCSLGAATLAMRHQIEAENCRIIAVDNSEAMLSRFQQTLQQDQAQVAVDVQCADIRDVAIENASVVVLNFTLQFIPLEDRLALLQKIYRGLLPGGILILSEKLKFDDERQQELQTQMHHAFKKAQGYSDLEISQKRTALENVLIPETFAQHQHRLREVGFSSAEVWFQYFNFASIIALK